MSLRAYASDRSSPATELAAGLAAAGVRRLFGMPGGGPNLDMIGAAAAVGIPFTLARGETAAAIAAGVYGLLTATPGTAVVTRGPGFTSAVNGLAQAGLDHAPLLLLADCVPAAQRARVAHQRLDQTAVAAPLTRWNGVLGSADPAATVAAAAALTAGPPAGAVHLDYDPGVPGDQPPTPTPGPGWDPAARRTALALATGARRPLVVLGGDAAPHAAALRAVLDGRGVPVLSSYQGGGVLDSRSPAFAGHFTNSAAEAPLLRGADLVVGVGLDGVEPLPGPWSATAPVLLLGDTATDPTYFGPATVVAGRPVHTLDAVLAACAPDWPAGTPARHLAGLRDALAAGPTTGTLGPVELARTALEVLGEDVQVTVDAGAHMLAVLPFWPATRPHQVLISNGLATMGYALPAAIGAALALADTGRDPRVVALVGDGGLGMALAELETLARLRLPVTVVVFDDAALSLIELKQRAGQERIDGGTGAVRFGPVDFAAVAQAMGVPGAVVGDVAGVRSALAGAGVGPFLLDARIDPAGYRHVLAVSRG